MYLYDIILLEVIMNLKNAKNLNNIIYDVSLFDLASSNPSNLSIIYFSNKPFDEINIINSIDNIIYISNTKTSFSGICFKQINKSMIKYLTTKFIIFIDIDDTVSFKYMKFLLNNIKNLFKLLEKYKIEFKCIYNNSNISAILSCNPKNAYFNDIVTCFKVLSSNSKREAYSIIYDYICDYLDSEFHSKNLCDFCDDVCIASRNGFTQNKINGCCYSYIYGSRWYYYRTCSLCLFAK